MHNLLRERPKVLSIFDELSFYFSLNILFVENCEGLPTGVPGEVRDQEEVTGTEPRGSRYVTMVISKYPSLLPTNLSHHHSLPFPKLGKINIAIGVVISGLH